MKIVVKILAGIAALSGMLAANAETVERVSPADPRGEVEIINLAGKVRVTGWDRPEVQVKAVLGEGTQRLEVQHDGQHTLIEVVMSSRHRQSEGSDLTINVPRDSRLVTNTVSADQLIEGVRGTQRLQSVSGDVRTQIWNDELEVKSVSGDVTVKGQKDKSGKSESRIRAGSVSGNVELVDVSGDMEANTVSGDMEVRAQIVTRGRFKTTNGTVKATLALAPEARLDSESINGDLSYTFDGALDADFDVETFNGDIENCFGPKPKQTHEYRPGSELRFKEGEGNARVRIKTLNGKTSICRSKR